MSKFGHCLGRGVPPRVAVLLTIHAFFLSWPPSSRGILSPSPLALPNQVAYILCWTYLNCSTVQIHSRRLGNELNGVIQISRFKHLNSAQLLLRFRVRTVRHNNLSVLPIHGHRRVGRLKSFLRDQMSVLPQFVVVAKTLVQHGIALALRHVFELARLEIAQTDVFHCSSPRSPPLDGSQQRTCRRLFCHCFR